MGLPGAGKTTLASYLVPILNSAWLNADKLREETNNWDFSVNGRELQAKKIHKQSEKLEKENKFVIADFVCPTPKLRKIFSADYVIWMNTIKESRFSDTNQMFIPPEKVDYEINTFNAKKWAKLIADDIKSIKKFKKLF